MGQVCECHRGRNPGLWWPRSSSFHLLLIVSRCSGCLLVLVCPSSGTGVHCLAPSYTLMESEEAFTTHHLHHSGALTDKDQPLCDDSLGWGIAVVVSDTVPPRARFCFSDAVLQIMSVLSCVLSWMELLLAYFRSQVGAENRTPSEHPQIAVLTWCYSEI